MKTVLITGTSSGIGRASVLKFHKEGWNVIATMRRPSKEKELDQLQNILICSKAGNHQKSGRIRDNYGKIYKYCFI